MGHHTSSFTILAAASALALAACGDDENREVADANTLAPAGGVGSEALVVYPIGTEASLESNALRAEVQRLQREGSGQAGAMGGNQAGGAAAGGDGNQTGTAGSDGSAAGNRSGGTAGGQAGAAGGMSGSDRDNDGRLSPAEYAIHTLPSETAARQGAVNDENPPFVSDEALNEVVTRFRQLDKNGDFFLSADEFQPNAR